MAIKEISRNAGGGSRALRRRLSDLQRHFIGRSQAARTGPPPASTVADRPPKGNVVVKAGPEGTLQIKAHLPGLKAQDMAFDVTGDILTLWGDRRRSVPKRMLRERRKQHLGFFQRAFRLPPGVAVDQVDAAFEDGTLTITLPRSAADRP